jgi:uncharacterized protein (TIGR02466 family)
MTRKLQVLHHFSVPVYSMILEGFAPRREAFIELILKKREKSPGLNISNQNGWHSDNDFHLTQDENIQWLNGQIAEVTRACIVNVDKKLKAADLVLNSCWANVSEYGCWNAPHNHFPSHWSGVFYVNVEDCYSETDKKDKNGKIEFLNPNPLAGAYGQPNGITYTPKNGQMLVFPAMLQHLVHPNLTQNLRITMAFNLNVIPPKSAQKAY